MALDSELAIEVWDYDRADPDDPCGPSQPFTVHSLLLPSRYSRIAHAGSSGEGPITVSIALPA